MFAGGRGYHIQIPEYYRLESKPNPQRYVHIADSSTLPNSEERGTIRCGAGSAIFPCLPDLMLVELVMCAPSRYAEKLRSTTMRIIELLFYAYKT